MQSEKQNPFYMRSQKNRQFLASAHEICSFDLLSPKKTLLPQIQKRYCKSRALLRENPHRHLILNSQKRIQNPEEIQKLDLLNLKELLLLTFLSKKRL